MNYVCIALLCIDFVLMYAALFLLPASFLGALLFIGSVLFAFLWVSVCWGNK